MGMGLFSSTSSCSVGEDTPACSVDSKFGNPNPKRFTILRYQQHGQVEGKIATAVEVTYPDAKNYEGRKVMVYLCSFDTIAKQTELDPHFCDDGSHLSPFARFEPTEDGWDVAVALAATLVGSRHPPAAGGK